MAYPFDAQAPLPLLKLDLGITADMFDSRLARRETRIWF